EVQHEFVCLRQLICRLFQEGIQGLDESHDVIYHFQIDCWQIHSEKQLLSKNFLSRFDSISDELLERIQPQMNFLHPDALIIRVPHQQTGSTDSLDHLLPKGQHTDKSIHWTK